MVAYSFKRQFVEPILSGGKSQTIRGERRRHARPGETMQLYAGMRTKACRLIAAATCIEAVPIRLHFAGGADDLVAVGDGPPLVDESGLDAFARTDGFADWEAMRAFWLREHPGRTTFAGVMVKWDPSSLRGAGSLWSERQR